MTRLLVVETSPRGDGSISRTLTRRFVADWRAAHSDGEVVVAGGGAKAVDLGEDTMDGFVSKLAPEIAAAAA